METSAAPKKTKLVWAGLALALLLIFGGVILHLFNPSRGEPLEPGPSVGYPADVPDEDHEGIPPEVFDEGTGDEAPAPANPL